jgi:hypothetical protein
MRREDVDLLPGGDVEQHASPQERPHRLRAEGGEAVAALDLVDRNAAVKRQVAGLMAQRVDVRAAVLHHRQHAGGAGARALDVGTIRIAMAAVQRVEVSGLVRGMARHPGEARLLEVEDARPRDVIGQRHPVTRGCARDRPR